jgi:zinc D-Ala-D-Ala carboxypeptidase
MDLRYFKVSDFDCQETGENKMQKDFLLKLDELRHVCGFPFIITSGYRSTNHSIEAEKSKPGMHSQGIAADILVTSAADRFELIKQAILLGFKGIGVQKTFIHVDTRKDGTLWPY